MEIKSFKGYSYVSLDELICYLTGVSTYYDELLEFQTNNEFVTLSSCDETFGKLCAIDSLLDYFKKMR